MKRPKDKRVPVARRLRRDATEAEKKLWRGLRAALPDVHWRKQATVGPYIVDFACHARRLVIELDGGQHAEEPQSEQDAQRDSELAGRGYGVLRFWNDDVMDNIEGVLVIVAAAVQSRPPTPDSPDPSPPPRGRKGKA